LYSHPARIANINLVGPLYAGFFYFLFRELKGEKPDIKAFFSGFQRNRLFALTASFLLPVLLSFVGGYSFFWLGDRLQFLGLYFICLLLFIFPGLYLSIAYTFTLPLVVERQLNFWRAMETSRQIVTPHWWGVLGFDVAFSLWGLFLLLPLLFLWLLFSAFYTALSQSDFWHFLSEFGSIIVLAINSIISGLFSLW